MYQGKRVKPRSFHKKPLWLLVSIALLLTGTVGGTLAYLIQVTDELDNEFQVQEISTQVVEENGAVSIKNTSETKPAYIRARVVANWVEESSGNPTQNIYGSAPKAGTDYTVSWGESGWVEYPADSGYFYYTSPVEAQEMTDELFTSFLQLKDAPAADYALSMEVIAQAVQADGADSNGEKPVVLAWGVDPETLS